MSGLTAKQLERILQAMEERKAEAVAGYAPLTYEQALKDIWTLIEQDGGLEDDEERTPQHTHTGGCDGV